MKCVSVTFLQPCGSNVAYHLRMLTLVAKKKQMSTTGVKCPLYSWQIWGDFGERF